MAAELIFVVHAETTAPDESRPFTKNMVKNNGWADNSQVDALLEAGYTKQSILDVILCIGVKTLSNHTNHLAHRPVDIAFEILALQKP